MKEMKKGLTPILDVCCGGKMFYFDHDDPNVTFCDIREDDMVLCDGRPFGIHPDVKCDFTNLPFDDESYTMVVFDPPHLIGKSNGWLKFKYGYLEKDWKITLTKGFSECFMVLKRGGYLIFKWNERDIPLSEVLKCAKKKPIFGHKSGKQMYTHWCCFIKE